MPVYLDYSATTPVHPEVLSEMVSVYEKDFGNAGSRTHSYGQEAARIVERARSRLASVLGLDKREVIFTSGATESDNLAILGLAEWGVATSRRHIVSTQIEHKAVLEPLKHLQGQGFDVDLVAPSATGRVSAEDVLRRVREDTLLVSVMHVNNETGVIQPVSGIGRELAKMGVFFHTDAAQSFGKLTDEIRNLDYDFLSLSSHKICGPQGLGALIVRQKNHRRPPLQPLMYGGGQEGDLRPGTLPVALIAGLGKAAELAESNHEQWWAEWIAARESILRQIRGLDYLVNGDPEHSLPNLVNLSFRGVDSEALMIGLKDDLAISNGSACTSALYQPSHVLKAMGLEASRIAGAVRISWGFGVRQVDLSRLRAFVAGFATPGEEDCR